MRTPFALCVALGGLTGVLGYTLFYYGGVHITEWVFSVVALGFLALCFWTKTGFDDSIPSLSSKLRWLVLLIPAYALLQCIPLPPVLVGMLSPTRFQVSASLSDAVSSHTFTALSVVPAETLAHAFRIVVYIVTFLLARELAGRQPHWAWLAIVPVALLATIEASVGLLQVTLAGGGDVARGTYVNRNHFAGLLEMALPFAVMYSLAVLHQQRPPEISSLMPTLKTCLALVIAAVLLLGIVYSLSRMGFIAALCSLLLMATVAVVARMDSRKQILAGASMVLLAVCSLIFLPPDLLIYRFAALSSTEALTAEGRIDLWRETLYLIADYPLVGCGLGAYESAFQKYKVSGPTLSDPYAHNDYLQGLAELGAIGFAIFSALSGLVLWRAVRVARQVTAPETRFLALACLGSISAILIHNLADFNLYIPANAMVFSWVLGTAAALPLLAERGVVWRPISPECSKFRQKSLKEARTSRVSESSCVCKTRC